MIRPTRGFQTMRTASATIKGFEVMRMIRHRHCLLCKPKVAGEIKFINKLFDVAALICSIYKGESRVRQLMPQSLNDLFFEMTF